MGSVVKSTMRRPVGVSMPSTATRGPSSVGGYFFANGSSSAGSEIISPPAFRKRFSRPWKMIAPAASSSARSPVMYHCLPLDLLEGLGPVVPEIAGEDGRPADVEHPHLPSRQHLVRLEIGDAHLDAGQRLADGAGLHVARAG